MSATLVTPKTTSGGEIIRELVNASDGAGLHFDGAAGSVAFTPVDLGTDFSFEFVIKQDSNTDAYIVDFSGGGTNRFIIGRNGNELQMYSSTSWDTFGVAPLDDGKVHHIVITVSETLNATLYDNGNQIATLTLNANYGLDAATSATFGSRFNAASSFFNGTIYRARVYNRALSADDVRTAYERADVPFADQYGSQTAILESDFSSGTSGFTGAGLTVAGNIDSIGGQNDTLRSTIDSSTGNHQTIRGISGTNGKRYRATGKVYIPSANALVDKVVVNNQGDLTNVIATITATDTWTDFETEFIREYSEIRFRAYDGTANSFAGNGSDVFYIKDIKIVPAGCVSDYDLAFANPTQSLTVQDRAGAADGTASTSGVTQVQPVVQLNSTSARIGTTAATPADGQLMVSGPLNVGGSTGTQTIQVESTNGYAQLKAISGSHIREWAVDTAGNFYVWQADNSLRPFNIDASGDVTVDGGDLKLKAPAGNQTDAELLFESPNNSSFGSTFVIDSKILSTANQTDNAYGSKLKFYTNNNSNTLTEQLSIDSSGKTTANALKVLDPTHGRYFDFVLDSSASYLDVSHALNLRVNGASSLATALTIDTTGAVSIPSATAAGSQLTIGNVHGKLTFSNNSGTAGTTNIQQTYSGGVAELRFGSNVATTSSSAMNISTGDAGAVKFNGLATFSAGVNLGNTASATATTLDGYEEGTWTCQLNGVTGTHTGYYTRIGNVVQWMVKTAFNTATTVAATFSGLPFTAANEHSPFVVTHNTWATSAENGYVEKNSTGGKLIVASSTSVATASASSSFRYCYMGGVYQTTDAF